MAANIADARKLWSIFPVNDQGKPTTYLCYRLLKLLFSNPRRSYTPIELANLLASDIKEVDVMCRQLHLADLLTVTPGENKSYSYNLQSTNTDVQSGFEKYLVDVEREDLPVHLELDYSPSTSD